MWITFNEPFIFLWNGYVAGTFAPGVQQSNALFLGANIIIKSHAAVYHLYDTRYRATQQGKYVHIIPSNT